MKYDETFPNAEVDTQPITGLQCREIAEPCVECKEICIWYGVIIEAYVCSFECQHEATQAYIERNRAEWMDDFLLNEETIDNIENPADGSDSTHADTIRRLLKAQHDRTLERLQKLTENANIALFFCSQPAMWPFPSEELPSIPVVQIPWDQLLSALRSSAPVELDVITALLSDDESVQPPITNEEWQQNTDRPLDGPEEPVEVAEPELDPSDLFEKVWMGSDPISDEARG